MECPNCKAIIPFLFLHGRYHSSVNMVPKGKGFNTDHQVELEHESPESICCGGCGTELSDFFDDDYKAVTSKRKAIKNLRFRLGAEPDEVNLGEWEVHEDDQKAYDRGLERINKYFAKKRAKA